MSNEKIARNTLGSGQGCQQVMLVVEGAGKAPAYATSRDHVSAFVSIHCDLNTGLAVVLLVDMDHGASVTNSASELLPFIQKYHIGCRGIRWRNVKWIYRDSMGAWDEIVPACQEWDHKTVAVEFRPLGKRTFGDAVAEIVTRGMPLVDGDIEAIKNWGAATNT